MVSVFKVEMVALEPVVPPRKEQPNVCCTAKQWTRRPPVVLLTRRRLGFFFLLSRECIPGRLGTPANALWPGHVFQVNSNVNSRFVSSHDRQNSILLACGET